jgi:gliding motility-associated-like protein
MCTKPLSSWFSELNLAWRYFVLRNRIAFIKKIFLFILSFLLFCFTYQEVFSQSHSSRNNYTGNWETPSSWSPIWALPQTSISGYDITINGYITVNGALSFSGSATNLIINDTLVIRGNLSLGNNNALTINDNGILIVRGNLTINNQTVITANGYFIITGAFIKNSSVNQGSFTSNDNPVKTFIGGPISSTGLTDNNASYPALNCTSPVTARYPGTNCSYGNLTDLMSDPIYPFFQSTCTATTPTITASGPTSFCTGGSVTLTSSSGSAYLWSDGATTQSIVITTSGSYSVRVTNSSGCQSASSVATVVTVNALPLTPTITAGGPVSFCSGGSVTLTSGPGTSYIWSNGATTKSINVITPGSFSVKVTNADGCQSAPSAPVSITVNDLPVVNAGTDLTIPTGTSTTLNAIVTGTGPFIFSWSPSSKLLNPLSEDPTTINLTTSTVFTLTATSTSTSCSNTDAVIVTTSGGSLVSAPIATPSTICTGTGIQLSAQPSGGSGSYTYAWTSLPAGFTSSVANPVANPSATTTYNVVVFDGFTSTNGQVVVTVNASPATPAITADGPATFCSGGSVNLTSSAGASYLWSDGETTSSINVTETGNYTVKVKNAGGCQSTESLPAIVIVNANPATPTIDAAGPTTFCADSSVILTASAGTTYLWSNGESTHAIKVTIPGSYTVKVTNSGGCQSAGSVATVVTVNALPVTPTITADGPTTFCDGGNVTLTSSAETNYLWSNGSTLQSTYITISGSYTVRTENVSGCLSEMSLPTIVTVNTNPIVNITSSNNPMCISELRTLTGIPAGGTFTVTDGPGLITGNVLSATGAGNITLEYVYANPCSGSSTQSIIVDENVTANAGPDQELLYVFETQMEADPAISGAGEWSLVSGTGIINDIHSPNTRITDLSVGENKFLWKVQIGSCEATDEVSVVVKDIVTPTVITPNNDGLNDELIFPGLVAFPGSSIIIYNRWGNEVYRSSDYKNDWNGKDDKKRDLQPDTYYYILKIANGRILKGFIEIRR